MTAQRKHTQDHGRRGGPLAGVASPVRPRLADAGDASGFNPTLAAQRLQLESFIADEAQQTERYSGVLRLAIIVGASGALWTVLVAGAWRLFAR